jgi:hypothetical protein
MRAWRLRVFDHTSGELTIDAIDSFYGLTPEICIIAAVDTFDRYDDPEAIIAELTSSLDGGIVERQDYTYQLDPIDIEET